MRQKGRGGWDGGVVCKTQRKKGQGGGGGGGGDAKSVVSWPPSVSAGFSRKCSEMGWYLSP